MNIAFRLLLVCALTAPAIGLARQDAAGDSENALQAEFRKLHWVHGPTKADLFSLATIDVPTGYVFLNQADTKKFMTLNQNLASGSEYLFAPEDMHWFGVFTFDADGYVKDDEKIDAASILQSISEGTEAANQERRRKGWPEMRVVGWKRAPYYDGETKRLEWAIDGMDSNQSEVVNFNVRLLGRTGVTSALLVVDPSNLDAGVGEFKNALRSYDYAPGQRYAEYKEGDKVAEYGLAALIAGGAAAVATKTGFWKAIVVALAAGWKIVAAGVVALLASIGRLFKRRAS